MDIKQELSNISRIGDPKEKILAYKELVSKTLKQDESLINEWISCIMENVLDEEIPLVISRSVLSQFASCLSDIDGEKCPWKTQMIQNVLNLVKPRVVSFEEQDAILREQLSEELIADEEYIEAAKVLSSINLESGSRQYSEEEKAEKYVKLAELYLQEDDTVTAENFINRASRVIHTTKEWSLKLRYQVSYARVLDSKRKFHDASLRYYELSQSNPKEVDADDLNELLSKAVKCAILAHAGPQRTRLLGTLFKDERVKESEYAEILMKMYREQLLSRPQITQFEESLLPHQKAILSNGFTVLENAVLEHNMLAASRVYSNIRLSDLGVLLGIDSNKAEKVAAQMIVEKRLNGTIDQIEGFLDFENDSEKLQSWDSSIRSICFGVNDCVDLIEKHYPNIVS